MVMGNVRMKKKGDGSEDGVGDGDSVQASLNKLSKVYDDLL